MNLNEIAALRERQGVATEIESALYREIKRLRTSREQECVECKDVLAKERREGYLQGLEWAAAIAKEQKVGANKHDDRADKSYDRACENIATAILAETGGDQSELARLHEENRQLAKTILDAHWPGLYTVECESCPCKGAKCCTEAECREAKRCDCDACDVARKALGRE